MKSSRASARNKSCAAIKRYASSNNQYTPRKLTSTALGKMMLGNMILSFQAEEQRNNVEPSGRGGKSYHNPIHNTLPFPKHRLAGPKRIHLILAKFYQRNRWVESFSGPKDTKWFGNPANSNQLRVDMVNISLFTRFLKKSLEYIPGGAGFLLSTVTRFSWRFHGEPPEVLMLRGM